MQLCVSCRNFFADHLGADPEPEVTPPGPCDFHRAVARIIREGERWLTADELDPPTLARRLLA